MKRLSLLFLVALVFAMMPTTELQAEEGFLPTVIPLWEGVPPGSEDFTGKQAYHERDNVTLRDRWITDIEMPTITLYEPEGYGAGGARKSGAAVLVFPGGAYSCVAIDKEGHHIAQWLSQQGIVAGVVAYRLGGGVHRHPVPLSDAQQAIRIVRDRAAEWGVDPQKVGVIGFSAGGHLAASAVTHGDADVRPNFGALIYPVVSMREGVTHGGSRHNLLGDSPDEELVALMSADEQVDEQTPSLFLVHSTDDGAVPVENSLRLYEACRAKGVPAELHLYPYGGHGYGMLPVGPSWSTAYAAWLKANGWVLTVE